MDRRKFMSVILAASCAPAIVRASSLMKVRGIIVPTGYVWLPSGIEWDMFRGWHQAMWPNLRIPCTQENYNLMLAMKSHLNQNPTFAERSNMFFDREVSVSSQPE